MAGIIQLVPVGPASRMLVKDLAEPIKSQFDLDAVVGTPLGDPAYAFNKDRKQYHSNAILRRLAAVRAKAHFGVLGVATVDLFVPDQNFVLGEADRESRTAMISLARLRPENDGLSPDANVLRRRAQTEAVHAVGHLVGLSQCDEVRCVMFLSQTAEDTDRKGLVICHDCRAEMGRLGRK